MKKLMLFISLAFGIVLNAGAQIIVNNNGVTNFGTPRAGSGLNSEATVNVWSILDPGAIGSTKYEGGAISFGRANNAMIGGDGMHGFMEIKARQSFRLSVGDNITGFSYTDSSNLFKFNYNVQAPSFLVTSDVSIKKNISDIDGMYAKLMDVNPVSYNLSYPVKPDSLTLEENLSKTGHTINDDRLHFGFVAQEIQKIYPNLVVEDEDGMLSIDYIGFIPVLVEAYKDLSNKVNEQEEFIANILNSVSPSLMPASVSSLYEDKPVLRQNRPNPFNSCTTIECSLPQDLASAFLFIYDLQGKQIKRMEIRERGVVRTVIEASTLTPGMYIYSLIADGNEIDSKRMIITD